MRGLPFYNQRKNRGITVAPKKFFTYEQQLNLKKEITPRGVVISLLGFILLWAVVTDAWGYSSYLFPSDNGTCFYGCISRLIWVLPAIFLIVTKDKYLMLHRKELFSRSRFNHQFVAFLLAILLYCLISMLAVHKELWMNREVTFWLTIMRYFVVGCVEETVFRGWGYNILAKVIPHRNAVAISTLLFVLLYWPAFFIKLFRFGTFDCAGLLVQSFSASLVGSWQLKKSRTLWNPILVHFAYDFLVTILIGGN